LQIASGRQKNVAFEKGVSVSTSHLFITMATRISTTYSSFFGCGIFYTHSSRAHTHALLHARHISCRKCIPHANDTPTIEANVPDPLSTTTGTKLIIGLRQHDVNTATTERVAVNERCRMTTNIIEIATRIGLAWHGNQPIKVGLGGVKPYRILLLLNLKNGHALQVWARGLRTATASGACVRWAACSKPLATRLGEQCTLPTPNVEQTTWNFCVVCNSRLESRGVAKTKRRGKTHTVFQTVGKRRLATNTFLF